MTFETPHSRKGAGQEFPRFRSRLPDNVARTRLPRDPSVADGTGWPRPLRRALLGTVCFAAFLLTPNESEACSGWYLHGQLVEVSTVPANGGLIASFWCPLAEPDCEPPDDVTVARDGVEVEGTIHIVEKDLVFHPNVPLEVGEVYSVSSAGTFIVTEAVTPALDEIDFELTLDGRYEPSTKESYSVSNTPLNSCTNDVLCVTSYEEVETAVVRLEATLTSEREAARGRFRILLEDSQNGPQLSPWTNDQAILPIVAHSEEYCAEVEFESFIDASLVSLGRKCLAHGTLPFPGDERPLTASAEPILTECIATEKDEAWCKGVSTYCELGNTEACKALGENQRICDQQMSSGSATCSLVLGRRGSAGAGLGLLLLCAAWRLRRRAGDPTSLELSPRNESP